MKRVIYSSYTKFIAAVLFITSIILAALTVTTGVTDFWGEKVQIYKFESDFSQSRHLSFLLDEPENAIYNVYVNSYRSNGVETQVENGIKNEESAPTPEEIESAIEYALLNLYCADNINYYVKWNDRIFTNCEAVSPEEVMYGEFFSYVKKATNIADTERNTQPYSRRMSYLIEEISSYDIESEIIIATSIKEDTITNSRTIWQRQEGMVFRTFLATVSLLVIALLMLIYLICVCGKNKLGEYKTIWIDNIFAEVHFALIGCSVFGAAIACMELLDEYYMESLPYNMLLISIGFLAASASTVVLTSLLSIIRNIKCKRIVKTSIILLILIWIYKRLGAFFRAMIYALSRKTGVILISMLLVYTAVIGILGILSAAHSPLWIFVGILTFLFASFIVAYRAKDVDEIKKGAQEVRGGNVAYKIPELKCEDMKLLANNINDIAKGLDESVSAKMRAERLKTELITNVSHDLKTPITSIISYAELLSKFEDLPEEARYYISVILKKSERLKNLTQDLFDISKVQSGNEDVVFEKLDVTLLINQSLGEHDSEIQKSGLPFLVDAPKELYISADGRKMSRAVSNLINNILKYTMKNTRVFIKAFENDGEIIMEFKNIASYPMNFSADEIAQRFVRGDEARTTEGSGLGLAIAKSYTELCNGRFEIVIDGDMFKVILKFRKYT